jgi:hypothetical protein
MLTLFIETTALFTEFLKTSEVTQALFQLYCKRLYFFVRMFYNAFRFRTYVHHFTPQKNRRDKDMFSFLEMASLKNGTSRRAHSARPF